MQTQIFSTASGQIDVSTTVPVWADEVELSFDSDRNWPISRMTDIAPENPDLITAHRVLSETTGDLLFPFVDLRLPSSGKLRMSFLQPLGECCFDPMRNKTQEPLSEVLEFPQEMLTDWENVLYVSERTVRCTRCEQVVILKPVNCHVQCKIETLSPCWNGTAKLVFRGQGRQQVHCIQHIEVTSETTEYITTYEETHEGIKKAVRDGVNFLLRCHYDGKGLYQNGLFLFYDLERKAYRSVHWNWTFGPSIAALLQWALQEDSPVRDISKEMIHCAQGAADMILRFENHTPGHLCQGIPMGRWQENLCYEHGVMGYYSIADSSFCAKWGLIPLYHATGEKEYLRATQRLLQAARRWSQTIPGPLPADYLDDSKTISDRTLDETMFVMGLYQSMWAETGDETIRQDGFSCFENICKKLRMGNGKWARTYLREKDCNNGFESDTKGHGWAMEGLLCAAEMGGDQGEKYLQQACATADLVIASQHEDGHWDNFFGKEDLCAQGGIGEKSTALWSWLLYRLYRKTEKAIYKNAAQKALFWCMRNLYQGADECARGSIVAHSVQSGIIYRDYFPMSCAYTTAFFLLAAYEELFN